MSTQVTTQAPVSKGRFAHTLPNGNALLVSARLGQNIQVWESSDRVTWTLRATLARPAGVGLSLRFTSSIDSQGNLHIATSGFDSSQNLTLHHMKFTYSTWAAGAWESVFGASSAYSWNFGIVNIDMDVSDGGIPYIAFSFNQGNTVYLRVGYKVGSTWNQTNDQIVFNGPSGGNAAGDLSIVTLSATNSLRGLMVAYTYKKDITGDPGVTLLSFAINESTGAITQQNNVVQNNIGNGWYAGNKNRTANIVLLRNPTEFDQWILTAVYGDTGVGETVNSVWVMRGRLTPGGSANVTLQPSITKLQTGKNIIDYYGSSAGVGINGSVMFYLPQDGDGGIANILYSFDSSYNLVVVNNLAWDDADASETFAAAGSWRNGQFNRFDTMLGGGFGSRHHYLRKPKTLKTFDPANGVNVGSATPNVTAYIYPEVPNAQTNFTVEYQASFDPSFTSGIKTFLTQRSKMVAVKGGTEMSPIAQPDVWPVSVKLGAGIWYVRARLVNPVGEVGDWLSDGRTFIVGHPPTATPTYPLDNTYFEYGDGIKTLSWAFSDTSATDSQTAYQIRIRRVDTNEIVLDTGKQMKSAKSHTLFVDAQLKNINLYWDVRLWDTDDAVGAYSTANSYFSMVDPASASITSPTAAQVLTNGVPTITAQFVTTGSRVVKEWVFTVSQAGAIIWSSKRYFGSKPNNSTASVEVPSGILKNNQAYTVSIRFVDDASIENSSPPRAFSTAWTVPASASGVAASASQYDVDGQGYVQVTWTDANREAEFTAWVVYRSLNGVLAEVGRIYGAFGTYTFRDYMAPSGSPLTYVVRQLVNRNGFVVESENITGATVTPFTDSYWLIDTLESTTEATKLYLVTGDSFTDEQEEATYNIIGRGRHVDKGTYLGVTGTLDIQLRHTGGIDARTKRLKLLDLQKKNKPLFMRNPFGDVYKVNVSSMSVGRIAGVGTSEFCDVQIPYSQVG